MHFRTMLKRIKNYHNNATNISALDIWSKILSSSRDVLLKLDIKSDYITLQKGTGRGF